MTQNRLQLPWEYFFYHFSDNVVTKFLHTGMLSFVSRGIVVIKFQEMLAASFNF